MAPPKSDHAPTTMKIDDIPKPYPPEFFEGKAFDELVADIKVNGIRSAVVLSAMGNLIDGYRRCLAALLAGLTEVPVVVDPSVTDKIAEAAYTFATETGRSARNPVSHLRTMQKVQAEFGLKSDKEVAAALKHDTVYVCRVKKLEKYPNDIIEGVGREKITLTHVVNVDPLEDMARKLELLRMAVANPKLSAAKLKLLAFPPKPKRGRKAVAMHTLRSGDFILSFPPTVTVEAFEKAIEELREKVAAALKDTSKKAMKLAELTGSMGS